MVFLDPDVEGLVTQTYATRAQAITARADCVQRFERELMLIGFGGDLGAAQALIAMRDRSVAWLSQAIANSRPALIVTAAAEIPVLVMAHLTIAGAPFGKRDMRAVEASVKDAERALHFSFVDIRRAVLAQRHEKPARGDRDRVGRADLHRLRPSLRPRMSPAEYRIAVEARSKALEMVDCLVDQTKPH